MSNSILVSISYWLLTNTQHDNISRNRLNSPVFNNICQLSTCIPVLNNTTIKSPLDLKGQNIITIQTITTHLLECQPYMWYIVKWNIKKLRKFKRNRKTNKPWFHPSISRIQIISSKTFWSWRESSSLRRRARSNSSRYSQSRSTLSFLLCHKFKIDSNNTMQTRY